MAVETPRRTLEELLAEAESRISRLEPQAALEASHHGALIVDIRSDSDRRRDGIVPGSLHLPRTVLEWRVDPESPSRNPYVGGLDEQLILLCDHGCSSILAAANLARLGFRRASDVAGGFAAWRADGLPTKPAPRHRRSAHEPAGMLPPDH